MKSRTLMAMAVASTFACASAFAGGGHGHSGMSSSIEVQTPSSVSESAPSMTSNTMAWDTHPASSTIGFHEGQFSDGPVGSSSSMSGAGSGGYDSSGSAAQSDDLSMNDMQATDNGDSYSFVEYWLLGDEPSGIGASSSIGASSTTGGSGSGGFDSMSMSPESSIGSDSSDYSYTTSWGDPLSFVSTSSADDVVAIGGEDTPLMSEYYLVYGPLASFDGQNVIVLDIGPSSEDIALLDSLSHDFYVLTPVYDEG